MQKYLSLTLLVLLTACFPTGESTNSTAQPTSVYISQFNDVPIPVEMNTDPEESLITVNADGYKVGTEVFSGNIEQNTLASLMLQNLSGQDWKLMSLVHGRVTLQLYIKDTRYLVLHIKPTMRGSRMELWVLNQLTNNEGNSVLQRLLQNNSDTPTSNDDFDTSPNTDFEPFPDEAFEGDLTSLHNLPPSTPRLN